MTHKTDADVLVIGAGPAGSMAAALLAQAGKHVVVVERGYFPRYSIGESLLPRCNELLQQANLLHAVEAKGFMVKRGAEFHRGPDVERFVFKDGLEGTFPTSFQVPRADFDQALATQARALGAHIHFGHRVDDVQFSDDAALLTVTDEERGTQQTLRAKFLLDCSGYGRVLPRLLQLEAPASLAPRSAYFTMVEGDLRPEGEREGDIWACVHPEGPWLWIIPFSNGRTSVGVVATQQMFDQIPGSDRDKMWAWIKTDPKAKVRLAQAQPVLSTMKLSGWSASVEKLWGPRWAIAGNAGDFLDPIFSSGVCIALESASRATHLALRTLEGDTPDWNAEYTLPLKRAVDVFRLFVNGWYSGDLAKLFFSKHKPSRVRQAVTSVLAGYVLDNNNPFVARPHETMTALMRHIG